MGFPQVFVESSAALASVNDAVAQHALGTLCWSYDDTWKSWRLLKYVKNNGAVAAAAGSVSTLTDVTGFGGNVTCDRNDDELGATVFGGAFLGTVTADYHGWVVIYGVADVTTDNAVAVADYLVPHTVDGQCDTMADGEEEQVFGVAFEAATTAAPTIAAMIRLIS